MSNISAWYDTAAGNNAQSVPDAAVENVTTVADLNNCQRTMQAGIRVYYDTMEWRDFGYVISSTAASAVTFTTDVPLFVVGQRVKITDTPAGVLYGTVTDNTSGVLTVNLDSGSLTTATMVEAGLNPTGSPAGLVGNTFAGRVSSTGTGVFLPPNWTSELIAAGSFRITHDLNTTDVAVCLSAQGTGGTTDVSYNADYLISSTTTIEVNTRWLTDNGVAVVSVPFSFIVST